MRCRSANSSLSCAGSGSGRLVKGLADEAGIDRGDTGLKICDPLLKIGSSGAALLLENRYCSPVVLPTSENWWEFLVLLFVLLQIRFDRRVHERRELGAVLSWQVRGALARRRR